MDAPPLASMQGWSVRVESGHVPDSTRLNKSRMDLFRPTQINSALRRRCHLRDASADHDEVAILLDRLQADALDAGELVGAVERAMLLAVGDDRRRLRRADVDQRPIDRVCIGRIDIDFLPNLLA